MISRYDDREIRTNIDEKYKKLRDKRNVNLIHQYDTPKLRYPSLEDMDRITTFSHAWRLGDRFYKLANKHYGDSKLWWIIAWFNQTPTEAHVEIGDIVDIPLPLEEILQIFGV